MGGVNDSAVEINKSILCTSKYLAGAFFMVIFIKGCVNQWKCRSI